MAKTNNLTDFLTDLADGIYKAETGVETRPSTEKINPQDFRERVEGLVATVTSTGDAEASQILSGKKAWVDGAEITGSMTNRGAVSQSLNAGGSYTIPAGYHDGSGKVTANSLASQTAGTAAAGEILSGETAWVGGSQITGTMTNQGAKNQLLTTANTSYTIPAGYHNGSGKVSISTEEGYVTPDTSTQELTPSSGKVFSKVTVGAISTQTKSTTPSTSVQNITPDTGKYLTKVTVAAIPAGTRADTTITVAKDDTADTLTLTASNNQSAGYVSGNKTASKTITLTTSGATATMSDGTNSVSKSVASGSATTPTTTITANPTISVGTDGLITATVSASQNITPTVSAGYVSSGTAGPVTVSGSGTSQLTVKGSSNLTASGATVTAPAGYYPSAAQTTISNVSGSIGGSATAGSATANITNVDGIRVVPSPSGTAGTNYYRIKATATGSAGSYTPKYTVSTGGYIGSTVTGTAQTVSVNGDSTGKTINIPKASFTVSGRTVKTTSTGGGYIPDNTTVGNVATATRAQTAAAVAQTANNDSTTNYNRVYTCTATNAQTTGYVTADTSKDTATKTITVNMWKQPNDQGTITTSILVGGTTQPTLLSVTIPWAEGVGF